MLNLCFEPFRAQIENGVFDLRPITEGAPDREYVLIRRAEPNVFYLADRDGFDRIIRPLEADADTPEGRKLLWQFYQFAQAVRRRDLGRVLCECLPGGGAFADVWAEPMENSVKLTVLPRDEV